MERNREVRRGSMAAMNGGGLSRRRPRSSGLRDSPEEDGAMEIPETSRLRERTSKRDRERDRSSRSKRRRGERVMHGGGREEGEDSSEESIDEEEEEEEEEQSVALRPPLPPPATSPVSSSSPASQSAHIRRSLPAPLAKPLRPPLPVWKVADEVMGVSVPRKARSASGKRLQDCWASGGSSGGGGCAVDPIHRQSSSSPARPSAASTARASPSSSNATVRKKLKPVGGATQRLPKSSKPSPAQEDIEFEVAEALFEMTRQFQCPPKQENQKDANGSISEGKSGASSPISQPSNHAQRNFFSNQGTTAPKRKRPRPVKLDDESPTSLASLTSLPTTSVPSTAKSETGEQQQVKAEDSSPRSEKNAAFVAVENGGCLPNLVVSQAVAVVVAAPADAEQDLVVKRENDHASNSNVWTREVDGTDRTGTEAKEEAVSTQKEPPPPDLDVNVDEPKNMKAKGDSTADNLREEKFSIDLMAPPPGKMSPEREDSVPVHSPLEPEVELVSKIGDPRREEDKMEVKQESGGIALEERKEKAILEESNLKKPNGKVRALDLQLDLEKSEREELGVSKVRAHKQQTKSVRSESKPEKTAPPAVSMPVAMSVSGWPGNLPCFGYMGQIPSIQAVLPMDASSGSSKPLQPLNFLPPQRPKRCATHCYIAQTIRYHQQLAKMNSIWPSAANTMQLYGAKPYNLNALPPSESAVLGNSLQSNMPGRSAGSLQDKSGGPVIAGYGGHPTQEKSTTANNSLMEAAQRKQVVLQQTPQPSSANSILNGPAFIFPLNQHTGGATAVSHPAAPKSASGAGNAGPSSATANPGMVSTGNGGSAAAVNFNYANLPPNEYLALLQNNGFPFPIPAHVGAPPYRGASQPQAMPFYGGSFYSSQMIHPSQLQQQPVPQLPPQSQQGQQNTSTSSGSSSSQKHPQHSQRIPGGGPAATGGSPQNFPVSKQGQHLPETGCEDSQLTTDRALQAQKGIYSHNFAMPIHPQNFALISPAAAAAVAALGGGVHSEKQPAPQAFAVSFASLTGSAATTATAAVPPGLDFSAMAHNHVLFQSLPEAARHGYQLAPAPQAAQLHKKAHQPEDGRPVGEPLNATMVSEEERKMMALGKAPASGMQQSLTFSRPESEVPHSSILSNSAMDSSSRTLNLIPGATNGSRASSRTSNAASATSASVTAAVGSPSSQQQQALIQLQKHQQQMHFQHQFTSRPKSSTSSSNASAYTERLQAGSTGARFSQTLSGLPQALIQSGGSPSQSPQWKNTSRSAAMPVPSPSSAPSSAAKSQLPQQQSRVSQQSSTPAHQTQISFGANSLKMAVSPTGPCSMPSLSSASSILVGSFPNSVNKSTGGNSPQAPISGKSVPSVSTTLPLPQQPSDKNSQSSSGLKPSPASNRNMPSILGQSHVIPAPSSSCKQLQQSQLQQKTPYPQAQFFFSSPYMPSQSSQSNASAVATVASSFYQRHPSELHPQQSQQHNSNPASMGVLSLCSSALTLSAAPVPNDPAKAMAAAASIKGLQPPGLLQLPSQPTSAGPYPLLPAAGAGFPYIQAMPSVSVKPAEQKPAAGNDSLNASWQPEKR